MRLIQYCIEHRGEIAGRGVDDLQYLGRRGLLLQRVAGLGQEPRILHRGHRLRGEILQQRNLSFRRNGTNSTVPWPASVALRMMREICTSGSVRNSCRVTSRIWLKGSP